MPVTHAALREHYTSIAVNWLRMLIVAEAMEKEEEKSKDASPVKAEKKAGASEDEEEEEEEEQEEEQSEKASGSVYTEAAQIDSLQEKKSGKPKAIKIPKNVKKQVAAKGSKSATTNKNAR